MPMYVRSDVATRAYQLAAYTTKAGDTSTRVQPWATDTNGARSPVGGLVIQLDASAGPADYIEYGGPDITVGNGLQLVGPGASAAVPAPNAAGIWLLASKAGLIVRGQVQ